MPASVPVAGETLEERLQVVERRVSDLQQQVARLANAADVSRVASPALGDSAIREVQKITEDMFSQPVLIEIEVDPSDPEFEYVVFTVRRSGEPKEIIQEHSSGIDGSRRSPKHIHIHFV